MSSYCPVMDYPLEQVSNSGITLRLRLNRFRFFISANCMGFSYGWLMKLCWLMNEVRPEYYPKESTPTGVLESTLMQDKLAELY